MASEYDKLIEQIEKLRAEMIELTRNKELVDPEVIAASEMLDVVLNEYDRIIRRKSRE